MLGPSRAGCCSTGGFLGSFVGDLEMSWPCRRLLGEPTRWWSPWTCSSPRSAPVLGCGAPLAAGGGLGEAARCGPRPPGRWWWRRAGDRRLPGVLSHAGRGGFRAWGYPDLGSKGERWREGCCSCAPMRPHASPCGTERGDTESRPPAPTRCPSLGTETRWGGRWWSSPLFHQDPQPQRCRASTRWGHGATAVAPQDPGCGVGHAHAHPPSSSGWKPSHTAGFNPITANWELPERL